MKSHLAEMLLDVKFRAPEDRFRKKHPFSEDIEATQAILFNPRYNKSRKISVYRRWLETNQPCVFGRVAAKNKNVFICLLEEHEILRMKKGDADLRDTIQDHRQVWKRYAVEGLSSSFLILLLSRSLVNKEPGDRLKEICRRLLELYMELDRIDDDTFRTQREYLFLRKSGAANSKLLKFSTLPNIFCAQADGRWWHDHRTPGGVMVTSNALGHFIHSRTGTIPSLQEKEKILALEHAMRTINNAYRGPARSRLKHCPATFLLPIKDGETSPLREGSDFRKYSADHYQGYFHADHLIPSVFFTKERDPRELKLYDNLTFRYIFDPTADANEHAELMTGVDATWYEAKMNMDRLPDYADPETEATFSEKTRGRLAQWLEQRLTERLQA